MATADVYKARIQVQHQTPMALAQVITGAPETKLYQRPDSAKWSIAEVLAHLAEAEIVTSWRYRQIIEHNGGPLSPYDQEIWNTLGDYPSRPPSDSLQMFRLLRENNLRLLDRLT